MGQSQSHYHGMHCIHYWCDILRKRDYVLYDWHWSIQRITERIGYTSGWQTVMHRHSIGIKNAQDCLHKTYKHNKPVYIKDMQYVLIKVWTSGNRTSQKCTHSAKLPHILNFIKVWTAGKYLQDSHMMLDPAAGNACPLVLWNKLYQLSSWCHIPLPLGDFSLTWEFLSDWLDWWFV